MHLGRNRTAAPVRQRRPLRNKQTVSRDYVTEIKCLAIESNSKAGKSYKKLLSKYFTVQSIRNCKYLV
jgi:hypothetical protein